MREVIRIDKKGVNDKPVEFTHYFDENHGWVEFDEEMHDNPNDIDQIVYLGKCQLDGDMFAAYEEFGAILIYKGHLNSGKY